MPARIIAAHMPHAGVTLEGGSFLDHCVEMCVCKQRCHFVSIPMGLAVREFLLRMITAQMLQCCDHHQTNSKLSGSTQLMIRSQQWVTGSPHRQTWLATSTHTRSTHTTMQEWSAVRVSPSSQSSKSSGMTDNMPNIRSCFQLMRELICVEDSKCLEDV